MLMSRFPRSLQLLSLRLVFAASFLPTLFCLMGGLSQFAPGHLRRLARDFCNPMRGLAHFSGGSVRLLLLLLGGFRPPTCDGEN